jgi:alpha-ketoglutarate-dependent taurine dioxygenase
MSDLEFRDLMPEFGAQASGFDPRMPLHDPGWRALQEVFDRRGLLVFRDVELSHAEQVMVSRMLIRKADLTEASASRGLEDNFYISNKRPNSAAPYGRLQFHSDTMWADQPFEVLSLYGVEVDASAAPTTFVSARYAWATLPGDLRARLTGLTVLHTAGQVGRGDLSDVLVTSVENPPSTTKPIGWTHPRTGETILYICEQMTDRIVGLEPPESEQLLEELFTHLYNPEHRWNHQWRDRDLVAWDNIALQHARPNVTSDEPPRTLRKVASPIPQLKADQLPSYSTSR